MLDINKAYDLFADKISGWAVALVRLLPNLVVAAVVLTLGIFLAGVVRRLADRLATRISSNTTLNGLFVSIIYFIFIGITLFTVLSVLKLDKAVTSILAGAGIVGLALAFAFQDIASNFISGIFISFRQPLHLGDIVKVKEYMGKIEGINLRDTVLRTFQGQLVIIPNKEVFQNPIENYSLLGKRRFDLTVGVSYAEDLARVRDLTLAAVQGIDGLSAHDEPTLFYTAFGDSSINFVLRLWIASPEQPVYLRVGSEAIMRIKAAYNAHGIMIPFPIRTLDFAAKGGGLLRDELHKADDGRAGFGG